MKTFYVTFGMGSMLSNYIFIIQTKNEDDARKATINTFGDKWAFMYNAIEGREYMHQYKKLPIYAKDVATF